MKRVSREHVVAWSSAAHSSRVPAVEHIGEQAFWSGPHMLRSGVQAVSVALAHGGQLGGTWRGGGSWWWGVGSCSTSIVPGGQELSRTQQESGGAFSKERSTGAPFLTPRSLYPALYLLLTLPLSSILPSFPFLGRLIHWLKCDFLVSPLWNCILPLACPSHPLIPLTYSPLELNRAMPLCFSIILSTSKSLMRRWLKRRKGPGMRQISLAFPSHNASHLNSPIYCWSPFWMVPLMKCCFCGSSHEFQRPQGYIFFFLSLTSKLSGTGRVGMTELKGHQVQHWMLFTV